MSAKHRAWVNKGLGSDANAGFGQVVVTRNKGGAESRWVSSSSIHGAWVFAMPLF